MTFSRDGLNKLTGDDLLKAAEEVAQRRFGQTLFNEPPELFKLAADLIVGAALEFEIVDLKAFDPAAVAIYTARIITTINARISKLEARIKELESHSSSSSS